MQVKSPFDLNMNKRETLVRPRVKLCALAPALPHLVVPAALIRVFIASVALGLWLSHVVGTVRDAIASIRAPVTGVVRVSLISLAPTPVLLILVLLLTVILVLRIVTGIFLLLIVITMKSTLFGFLLL